MRNSCADIVHEVVVVGSNRPLPCLFLEIRVDVPFDTAIAKEKIAQTVIQRSATFNQRLFPYERIDESIRIHMLAVNSLPRTKVCYTHFVLCVLLINNETLRKQEKGNIR